MLRAPNFSSLEWLTHGFGLRNSEYPANVTTAKQIHSSVVIEATAPSGDRIAEADAIVTRQTGIIVGVRTADCVPILLADSCTHAVAAIHAGWRGSAQNIVNAAVCELITRYGAKAKDLHAAIGPAIGPCCYEVGPDVARRFGTWFPEWASAERPIHIDLVSVNERQLTAAGVRDIWKAEECTFCREDRFFSFRREREQAGRMLSFIGRAA